MTKSKDSEVKRENLPIYTHTYVLGADIGVHQRDRGETDIMPTGERSYITRRERQYIASWARSTLFGDNQ